ncbi:MAG: histidine phosphatase family protein [Spirochaetaceae bacterium]|nr:histidine phosphatase family protein [Spirochaetaceae bacterium]
MRSKRILCGLLVVVSVFLAVPVFAGGGGEKPVTIYVTRHGRTLFNTKELAQGWADSPLTPEGIAVAEDLGRGLRDVPFDYVISSDLVRARQTARLVMAQNRVSKNYRLEDTETLREACYGQFEGDPNGEMIAAFAKETGATMESMMQDPYMWLKAADSVKRLDTSGMAEDAATIKARMQGTLTAVAKAQAKKGGNVLLVAHGQSINIMLSDLDPAFNYTGTSLANAAVSKVVYQNGKFTIESFNDTSYIDAGKALR